MPQAALLSWHAEFKKFLEVEYAGNIEKKELLPDTGGYASVALINNYGVLEVKTLDRVEYSVAVNTLPQNMRLYLGRFDFDSGHKSSSFRLRLIHAS